jgi:hypothetical protein
MEATPSVRQETQLARLETRLRRGPERVRLADFPTCGDGIVDHRTRYSPSQSMTALPVGYPLKQRRVVNIAMLTFFGWRRS